MRNVHRFFLRWQNWLGVLLVLFFVVVAMTAPILSPMDPKNPEIFKQVARTRAAKVDSRPYPPSEIAILGTLPFQYDIFHTLVWGTRDALRFGLMVVLVAGVFGVVYGATAGFSRSSVNTVMMRVADAFLAFPVIAGVVFLQQLLAIAVEAAGGIYLFGVPNSTLGPGRIIDIVGNPAPIQIVLSALNPLFLSLILFMWMPYARLVNSIVISLKDTGFIHASQALGSSSMRTVFRHIIPNSVSPAVVLMARDVGGVVILQATLTFIGLGGDSPWGDMLSRGRNWILSAGGIFTYWWVYIPATVAVMLFAIAWNLLGDGLNDVLDPTAQYDFHRPPFWRRLFKRKEKQLVPEPVLSTWLAEDRPQPASFEHVQEMEAAPVHKVMYSDGTDPLLLAARAQILDGNLSSGLHAYRHLIQHDRMIQEILPDLAQLAQKYPREPQIWQILGDGLARTGDMVHANQSYDRARKLRQQTASGRLGKMK
jgi:peptide/nickel transport system permease protein